MKGEKLLIVKIFVLAMTFLLAACQKSGAENLGLTAPPVVSTISTVPATATPPKKIDDSIRKIDFRNFSYPAIESSAEGFESFALKNGERPSASGESEGVELDETEYSDVTGDGAEEAILTLSVETGGTSIPHLVYIYTLKNKKTELLWSFMTGDRAQGGLKDVLVENGELIVETFGDSRFENDRWEFRFPEKGAGGYCCPTAFTKIRFKWNGEKFVRQGEPEMFEYDWKNRKKESN